MAIYFTLPKLVMVVKTGKIPWTKDVKTIVIYALLLTGVAKTTITRSTKVKAKMRFVIKDLLAAETCFLFSSVDRVSSTDSSVSPDSV